MSKLLPATYRPVTEQSGASSRSETRFEKRSEMLLTELPECQQVRFFKLGKKAINCSARQSVNTDKKHDFSQQGIKTFRRPDQKADRQAIFSLKFSPNHKPAGMRLSLAKTCRCALNNRLCTFLNTQVNRDASVKKKKPRRFEYSIVFLSRMVVSLHPGFGNACDQMYSSLAEKTKDCSEQELQDIADVMEGTYEYSVEQNVLTLTDSEYGSQKTFEKKWKVNGDSASADDTERTCRAVETGGYRSCTEIRRKK